MRTPSWIPVATVLALTTATVSGQIFYNPGTGHHYAPTPISGTLAQLRRMAAAMGGTLVSIGSAAEQNFVGRMSCAGERSTRMAHPSAEGRPASETPRIEAVAGAALESVTGNLDTNPARRVES